MDPAKIRRRVSLPRGRPKENKRTEARKFFGLLFEKNSLLLYQITSLLVCLPHILMEKVKKSAIGSR